MKTYVDAEFDPIRGPPYSGKVVGRIQEDLGDHENYMGRHSDNSIAFLG